MEHPIGELDQEYKMGRALPVKYSEYFGGKRRESLKNENIRYDSKIANFCQITKIYSQECLEFIVVINILLSFKQIFTAIKG